MSKKDLLVVDGYNVIYKGTRYQKLIDDNSASDYSNDPHIRARELLISDVAAYAQQRFEPVIVFDGGGNLNSERPNLKKAGVKCIFSETNITADTVIEKLVTKARRQERKVTVVTSDNTIRATIGTGGVTRVSADLFVSNITRQDVHISQEAQERSYTKLTLEDRLDPSTRDKINKMLGRY